MKKFLWLLGCVISLFFISTTASAQEPVGLEPIVVSASRIAQHDYKVASNVTVITQKDIKQSTAQSVAEVIKNQVGINYYDNSSQKTSTIDIRGFGDTANRNVLFLVNDRKITPFDNSGPDLLQIPLESIERIEIIRGAGSVLYGDNAVGGVVNIITKEGKGDLKGSVGANYGSYETHSESVDLSGEYKAISYYLDSKVFQTDGFRSSNELESKDFQTRFGYRLTDILKADVLSFWHEDHYRLPSGLKESELKSLGRRGSRTPLDVASTRDRQFQLSFDLTPWPQDIQLGHFILDTSYRNRDTFANFGSFDFATISKIDQYGLNGKYVFDQTLFNKEFNFVTGFDYYTTTNQIIGANNTVENITISRDELGLYLFTEYEIFDKIFVNGGTRYQDVAYIFDKKTSPASTTYQTTSPAESVNMVGAKYEYAAKSNVFFNVQQSFRFLSTDEFYDRYNGVLDSSLSHQRGIQYETGIKHNYHDMVMLHVTPYWIDTRNEIFFDPNGGEFFGTKYGANNNYDKTQRRGIEVGQEWDILNLLNKTDLGFINKIDLITNYSSEAAKFNGGINDDKNIPLVPEQQASAGINFRLFDKYRLDFLGKYVGERFVINDTSNNSSPLKPYYTLDAKLSFEHKNMDIYLGLNNLANEQYFVYAAQSPSNQLIDYFPAPGRNYTFGVKYKF